MPQIEKEFAYLFHILLLNYKHSSTFQGDFFLF